MALRKLGKILLSAVAGVLIFGLLLMLGVKLALDRAPRYQAEIKDWVYARTGYHVAFARVFPAFRWYGPELYFDQLEFRSKDDQRVLARAAGGRVGVDFWQLLHSGKLFALRVELDSPDIMVARIAPDTFALASEIVLGGEDESLPSIRLNDLPAGTLAIRNGFVSVKDWNPALPDLKLREVKLDLRRASDLFTLKASADLPAVLGGTLKVSGAARGEGLLASLDWRLLASARNMAFAGWRELLPEYLTRLDAGAGGFDAELRGRGPSIAHAELTFGARDVVTQLVEGSSARFEQISGAMSMNHAADRWVLSGRRMHAQIQGRHDPDAEFDVSWRGDAQGLLELGARASYLRAETLLPLAGLIPQKDLRARLRDFAPTGEWMDMRVKLARSSVDAPWALQCGARFRGMGFAPTGGAPGLRGLNGTLAGTESGGRLDIESQSAVFHWPHQFPQPIELTKFKATLFWKRTAELFLVATPDFELHARGAVLRAKVAWQQSVDGASPTLTLAGSIDGGNVVDAHLFFPRELLPAPTLAWLDRAFIAGRLAHADLVLRGPVLHFPFRDGSGLFLARAFLEGLTLDYREEWPRIENLTGQAEFRNEGMSARFSSGRTGGLTLDSGSARFLDFRTAELQVETSLHGDARDALQFLKATPLDALAEGAFSAVEGRGALKAGVSLDFPFKQFERRRVLVHVNLADAAMNMAGSTLAATELSGEADIDGAQVARADVRGRLLGGAFQMTARAPRNRPVTRTALDFRGTFAGDALRAALALPDGVRIGGDTDWRGTLKMSPDPARERSLHLASSLSGLELKLPAPLAKPAGTALNTTLDTLWLAGGATQVRIGMGSLVRAALNLESGPNGAKLSRVAVAFGGADPIFSDAQLINVGGAIEQLDLAGWLRLAAAPGKNSKPLTAYLRTAKIAVAEIDYLGFAFREVTLGLAEVDGGWRIAVAGADSAGAIVLPASSDPTLPWSINFERLKLFDLAEAPTAVDTSAAGTDPRSVPAINFHAAQLRWGDREFGDVRASLVKVEDGIALQQLKMTSPSFGATAKGDWRGKEGGVGRIEGTITSTDVAATLKQLGFAGVIEAKSGRMTFDLRWIGAPTGPALELATGHVQVAMEKGQIVGLKPGAGRVLGLASVAALPRRLALDFSDLTDKGLAFDTVHGDFELKDGSAYTENVLVRGPAAEIGLIGRVGLKNKDYDQTAVVTGNVGNGALPFAAFAGGPVIGAAVVLFTQVFKQPLRGLARGYYRITGSWDNPIVERIKSADAAAAAEAPQ